MCSGDAITCYTFWLMIFTGVLAFVALIQIYFLIKADKTAAKTAQAAKDSAEIANKTLIASQRAWIRIDQIGFGGGGLAIDANGASVSVSFRITNIGNSPAINITPHAWLIVLRNGALSPLQEQQRRCGEIRHNPFSLGFTLFPGESFPDTIGLGGWSLGVNATRVEIEEGATLSVKKNQLMLFIVGCIDYTFPTDASMHHQTGFIYELRGDDQFPISFENGIIPIDNLRLTEAGIGVSDGRFAD